MRLTAVFVLATFVASSLGATVANVLSDIGVVSTRLATLVSAINAFPTSGGSLTQALAIHNDAGPVNTALNQATTDAKTVPTPIAVSDGRSILTALEGLEPNIDAALDGIVARKPAFDALPLGGVSGLVKQDISTLSASTNAFDSFLLTVTPSSLLSEATALKSRIDAKFANAIKVYA